ncbi:hybrid sensor histidine kinase/response regulator [Adhaeribacter arboris]|uniref:histidine kinase n=1 Tax=Adhaeribacter arboris TaxID=2072846 RepID=A0A2T2Y8V2_9BACT|nr:hybrid sensor histidine kinase/response regulator transcription factor [Adhaeribacter arboris]PSR51952.1 hybrid sensor histidine kinase/response regulator [Adhaeribacter arboris]
MYPMWKWLLLVLVVNLFWLSARGQQSDLPPPELITDRQGLPQGFVPGIVQDQQGFIWMATRDGLCRYDGNRFKVFRPESNVPSALSFSDLQSLQLDPQGYIWITSELGQVVRFNPRSETFQNFSEQIFPGQNRTRIHIQHCYPDRQNRLWLGFDGQGLLCFNLQTGQVRWFRHQADQPHSIGSNRIRSIVEDISGNIWLATDAGLDQYEEKTEQFAHYRLASETPLALPELDLHALYLRPNGEILIGSANYFIRFNPQAKQIRSYQLSDEGDLVWGVRFATDRHGVVYFNQRDRLFRFTDESGPEFLTNLTAQTGFCRSLFIDQSDVLWLGTNGMGVRKYDLRSDGFQTARYQTNFHTDLLVEYLRVPATLVRPYLKDNDYYHFRSTLDQQGAIWLNVGSSTFYHINLKTRQTKKVNFPVSFVQEVSPLSTDEQGRVWVLHDTRFWWYDPQQRQWLMSSYQYNLERTQSVVQMVADNEAFWLATQERGLFRLDRRTGKLRQYSHQPKKRNSLSNNALFCLSKDPSDSNRLWIGTFGSGLCAFDKRTGQCQRITEQQGLPNNVIYSALPDEQGYLWMGTNKGLCRMNRKTFQTQVYTTEDGLLANEFNRFHYLQLPTTGQMIMAGVEGFTVFQPTRLQDDLFKPQVELTELQINNRVVETRKDSLLTQPIHTVKELILPYNQNFITASFAALQYNRPGKNQYRYQLVGVDDKWVKSQQPQAVYTALPPGEYTLRINASNTSGHWSPYVRQLTIIITPPWWRSWWAYLLYGFLLSGMIWYGTRLYVNRLRLQQTVVLRQQEARQLRELDELKSRFLTNITHDFRTPLTLILSPLEGLIHELASTPYRKRLGLIQRNAQQLLGLINQLLDFSKLEAQMLPVQELRGNLTDLVAQTLQLFQQEAADKSIPLTYQSDLSGDYWFDAGKLERILSNLVANALKFTSAGGQITVSLQVIDKVLLTVTDTGLGIPPEKLPYIFDRFFQVNGDKAGSSSNGTGIGLSLVKELVELQGGQITVESELGKGTTFRVWLPLQPATEPVSNLVEVASLSSNEQSVPIQNGMKEVPLILLVEDNPELADFIQDSLPSHYQVSRATNGAEGLEQALAELPDAVISDVMMPVMDGYTFCHQLKTDERTSHIPVILLTAKAAMDSRLEGLTRGADDYLTKPFHVPELNLRLHNLLQRQRRYQQYLQQELVRPANTPTTSPPPTPLDPFLEKLYQVVEARLDDTSFGVEQLAEELNVSRVHLHRKLKALVGLPAGDIIRNYRLKRATFFLLEGLNSSETAYRVGFDSPPYFAKCFREVYQMSPREFARQSE